MRFRIIALVHMCGMDSIPADLGIFLCVNELKKLGYEKTWEAKELIAYLLFLPSFPFCSFLFFVPRFFSTVIDVSFFFKSIALIVN